MWQPGWEGTLGEKGYMCPYGWSIQGSPETIMILLGGYILIEDKV